MGISPSKRVKAILSNSPEFDSACDSSYSHCLSLTQHAFPGVFPYQLVTAADHLHSNLSATPLIHKFLRSPPTRSQIHSALRVVTRDDSTHDELLGQAKFKEWAVEVYTDAIVDSARKAVLSRVPIGIAGIAGLGIVTRSGRDLVGTAIGVYAVGTAASIYLSLFS